MENRYFHLLESRKRGVAAHNRLIQQEKWERIFRTAAQNKYPNMVKLEQNPGYSARPSVVN